MRKFFENIYEMWGGLMLEMKSRKICFAIMLNVLLLIAGSSWAEDELNIYLGLPGFVWVTLPGHDLLTPSG